MEDEEGWFILLHPQMQSMEKETQKRHNQLSEVTGPLLK